MAPRSSEPRCAIGIEEEFLLADAVTGATVDPRGVYWHARLSPRYPTVEVRIADVCLSVRPRLDITGHPDEVERLAAGVVLGGSGAHRQREMRAA